jgi:hypothetical protein
MAQVNAVFSQHTLLGMAETDPKMVKYMGLEGEKILLYVAQLAWKYRKIPSDWKLSVIIPIFKKGDNQECLNHRGISLLSVPGKVYSLILETRLKEQVEHQLEEAQCVFRQGRSTQDLIFMLCQISEKVTEYDSEVHICYLDLEKAFDKVPWREIWHILKKRNVEGSLVAAIRSYYRTCRNQIRTANIVSVEFRTIAGVRQGDILAPYLFIILMDNIMKDCKQRTRDFTMGNWKMHPVQISEMAFAEDVALIAKT